MTSLLLAGALLFQILPAPAPPTRTFTDPHLRIAFTYPAAFLPQDMNADVHDALEHAGPAFAPAIPCIRTPLSAVRNVAPQQNELLLMLKLDFGCMGRQVGPDILTGIAVNALKQGLARIGEPTLTSPVHYSLGKYDAVFVQGSVPQSKEGLPGFAAGTCTLVVNTVLCWEVLTAYPSHIAPLLASTVAFGKSDPTPIVPAALIHTPPGPDPTPGPAITQFRTP